MSGLPLISRRRLLTAMALSPLLWQMNTAHAAVIDPNRIVALEWLPVELLQFKVGFCTQTNVNH